MADNHLNEHVTAERAQAWLEGDLPPSEAAALEEHTSSCARCHSEIEAWRLLFAELSEISSLSPSPDFAASVMDRLDLSPAEAPVPLAARVKGWLGLRGGKSSAGAGHLAPELLQDLVEGILPVRALEKARGHLAACGSCRRQEAEWRALAVRLGSLPRRAPAPGFAQRVMARVHVGRPVPVAVSAPTPVAAWGRRILAWPSRLQPRSRKAWALLAGAGLGPVAAVLAAAAFVATHPLLTVGNLASFGWWQLSEAAGGLLSSLGGTVMESAMAFKAFSLLEMVSGSMGLVLTAGGAFSVLTVLSLWVLYRNLVNSTPVDLDEGYAPHHSF